MANFANSLLSLALVGLVLLQVFLSLGCTSPIRYRSSHTPCVSSDARVPEPGWPFGTLLFSEAARGSDYMGQPVWRTSRAVGFEGFDDKGRLKIKYHHPRPRGGKIVHYDSSPGTRIPVRLRSPDREQIHIIKASEDKITYEIWPTKDGCP